MTTKVVAVPLRAVKLKRASKGENPPSASHTFSVMLVPAAGCMLKPAGTGLAACTGGKMLKLAAEFVPTGCTAGVALASFENAPEPEEFTAATVKK